MNLVKLAQVFKEKGINEYEVYHVVNQSVEVSTFNGNVDQNTIANQNEYFVRGASNGHISTIYVERDDDEEINYLAEKILESNEVIESDEPYQIFGGSKEYLTLPKVSHDFSKYSQADLIKICQNLENYCKTKCEFVKTTEAQIEITSQSVSINNSSNLNISRNDERAVVVLSVVVEKDGDTKNGYSYQYVENLSEIDVDSLYEKAVLRTLNSIGAKSLPSKQYPVVFENRISAQLLSCFKGLFSADAVLKKISPLKDRLNEQVFGKNITFKEDPISKVSPFKYTFDDEGVATKEQVIVENGVLKTYLHDLKTAKMMNVEPTGNGFKFGACSPANLTLVSDDIDFDSMIQNIEEGVFITELMGTHAGVNLSSGSFNLQAAGFKIEQGKITSPVTLIIVSGNILDMLNNVVSISNDLYAGNHIVSGSIYVKQLNISGK